MLSRAKKKKAGEIENPTNSPWRNIQCREAEGRQHWVG